MVSETANVLLTPFNSPVSIVEEDTEFCDHGISFNYELASSMTKEQVEETFPILRGKCPKNCGFYGVAYFNNMHYALIEG